MAWLQLGWQMSILKGEERGEDEASLQFAFVTVFDGVVRVDGHTTGNLFPRRGFGVGGIGWPGGMPAGTFRSRNVPTERNPFLGFAARAVEQDNSGSSQRRADNERFYENIRVAAQDNIRTGGIPDATTLWRAGNASKITDNVGDDDNKIGVSARVFPNYGTEVWPAITRESDWRGGGTVLPGTIREFHLTFQERGARYEFDGAIRIVTNTPSPSSP